MNKNLELNLLINFEVWNQNDLLNSTPKRQVNSEKLTTMQNVVQIKESLSVTMAPESVLLLGFNFP